MAYSNTHKQIHEYQIKKDTFFQALVAAVTLFVLTPVLIYFYHVIPSVGFKLVGGIVLFVLISNILAKIAFNFIDNYNADNSIPTI